MCSHIYTYLQIATLSIRLNWNWKLSKRESNNNAILSGEISEIFFIISYFFLFQFHSAAHATHRTIEISKRVIDTFCMRKSVCVCVCFQICVMFEFFLFDFRVKEFKGELNWSFQSSKGDRLGDPTLMKQRTRIVSPNELFINIHYALFEK